ncbi:hypothetical protein RHSIM_Rhsim11G0071600 [Rhododendron simsii]|uniref:WAT1-related protein n=1 Tax=Rhododendron simsii TaxID=118357 RepID=A0A834GB05_RHOSS|nr:hypothetical protein RHSIM_Rhsim11G0071600 [Rhododendron simsii]
MKYSIGHLIKSNKPYIGVLFIQFVYAIKALFAKAAIAKGMNPYVFVFYRQAFASLALAPFAFFLESNKPATLSLNLLCKIFFISLCGITLSVNLDSLSLNYVSATFSVAICTTVPAITFIMAIFLRIESISIKQWHGLAKVVGSIVSLSGALVYILIQGPPVYQADPKASSVSSTDVGGGLLLVGGLYGFLCGKHEEGKAEKIEQQKSDTTEETEVKYDQSHAIVKEKNDEQDKIQVTKS